MALEPPASLAFSVATPIFFVVVPSVADWFVAVHEYVEAPALFAIEVLHAEPAAIAGPFGEVLAGEREGGRGQDVGDETVRAQAVDELLGGVRSRLVDEYGAAVLLECVGVRLGLHQGRPVGEIAMRVTERREDEVQLLAVVWPTPQG